MTMHKYFLFETKPLFSRSPHNRKADTCNYAVWDSQKFKSCGKTSIYILSACTLSINIIL